LKIRSIVLKTLFIGGIKSGKSRMAEAYMLEQTKGRAKPFYLATTEWLDDEILARIEAHRERRGNRFITLEEPLRLAHALQTCMGPVLVECVSMWLNNMLHHRQPEALVFEELAEVLRYPSDLVFVQNEVGLGVIAENALARQYIDLSGKVAQLLAAECDRVYFCSAGLKLQLK
jgi:adenosylcobinamide kinase / adenosylcobinamide-phosphate guanylyltransferase